MGVPGFTDVLGIGASRHVVVCLVDGLGAELIARHQGMAPRLAAMAGQPISASFPTTTPVGLGSFGTGLPPGGHGLVGASFLLPEDDQILVPLHWGGQPTPVAVQPEPTVFEAVARAGVSMATIAPVAYRDSGLTRAVLRGAEYRPAEDVAERVSGVRDLQAASARSFAYVYWAELDRTGHEFGIDSEEWRTALRRADDLAGRLCDALAPGSALVLTADHGMVDCPATARVQVDDEPALMAGVARIAGEPRARHVYARRGAAVDVRDSWQAVLGPRARVMLRSEVTASGLMGPVDPALADRIGDVMAVCEGTTMLATRWDAVVSSLLGQHGALSVDEVSIPALLHRPG